MGYFPLTPSSVLLACSQNTIAFSWEKLDLQTQIDRNRVVSLLSGETMKKLAVA